MCEARLAARLGDADRAIAAGNAAFDLMATTSWRVAEWFMRVDLALLELSRADASAALEFVAGALDPSHADESGRLRWGQAVAVEALVALGRHDEADAVVSALEEQARSHGSPRLIAEAVRAHARLSAAAGDLMGPMRPSARLRRSIGASRIPWELAHTLLVAGDIHRRARRRARARAALREALESFAFLGARLWARQAQEQLARIDASRERGGLTPTQRRVAELAASGLTNRMIADRLYMSAHTVEAHLSAIYRALDLTSRSQLSAALSADGTTTPGIRPADPGSIPS